MRPGCPLVANAIVFASLSALATGGCRGGSIAQAMHDPPHSLVDAAVSDGATSAADGGPQPARAENRPRHEVVYGGVFTIDLSLAKTHRRHRRAHAFLSSARHAHEL
jgi:hypothetical protein